MDEIMTTKRKEMDTSLESSLNDIHVGLSDSLGSIESCDFHNSTTQGIEISLEGRVDETVIKDVRRKKRRIEKQLQIDMTPKMKFLDNTSPESAGANTSRYGRARKHKTDVDFYPTDLALMIKSRMSKSPNKSPKKNNLLSPSVSPITNKKNTISSLKKYDTIKKGDTAVNNDDEMQSVTETKIIHTPWNEQLHRKPLKVYVRKNLIQNTNNEDSSKQIRNTFSFSPSFYGLSEDIMSPEKGVPNKKITQEKSPLSDVKHTPKKSLSLNKINRSSEVNSSVITQSKSEISSNVGKRETNVNGTSQMISMLNDTYVESHTNSLNDSIKECFSKDTQNNNTSVLTSADGKYKKETKAKKSCTILNKNEKQLPEKTHVKQLNFNDESSGIEPIQNKEELEIVSIEDEDEASCKWKLDELLWARVGSYPFWPCLITRDPVSWRFVKKKKVGRSLIPVEVYHVTFFGDSGRRSWLLANCLMRFEGLDHFNKLKESLSPEIRKKDPKYCGAFEVRESKKNIWLSGVEEAEMLMRRPPELREEFFVTMFISNKSPSKGKKKNNKSEISLSESMFDSLFNVSNDVSPNSNPDVSAKSSSESKSVDVVNFVDNCLNSIAAKTGNEKIKVQTHMDRWLLKAKMPLSDANYVTDKHTKETNIFGAENCLSTEASFTALDENIREKNIELCDATPHKSCKVLNMKRRKSVSNVSQVPLSQIDVTSTVQKKSVQQRRKSIATFDLKETDLVDSVRLNDTNVYFTDKSTKLPMSKHRKFLAIPVESRSIPTMSDLDIVKDCPAISSIANTKSITNRRKSVTSNIITHESEIEENKSADVEPSRISTLRRRKTVDCRIPNPTNMGNNDNLSPNEDSQHIEVVKEKKDDVMSVNDHSFKISTAKAAPRQRRRSIAVSRNTDINHSKSGKSEITNEKINDPMSKQIDSEIKEFEKPVVNTIITQTSEIEDGESIGNNTKSCRISTLRRRKTLDCKLSKDMNVFNCESNLSTNEETQYIKIVKEMEDEIRSVSASSCKTSMTGLRQRRKSIAISPNSKIYQTENYTEDVKKQNIDEIKDNVTAKQNDSEIDELGKLMQNIITQTSEIEDKKIPVNANNTQSSRISTLRRRKTLDCRISSEMNVSNSENSSSAMLETKCNEIVKEKKDEIKSVALSQDNISKTVQRQRRKSIAVSSNLDVSLCGDNGEDVKKQNGEGKKNKIVSKYDDPEFQKFLELRKDAYMEEYPDLTEEDAISCLYKTWQYSDMKSADDYCLVKGMTDELVIPEPKKRGKRYKDSMEEEENDIDIVIESTVAREKPQRKKTIKSYFTKDSDSSDTEDIDVVGNTSVSEDINKTTEKNVEEVIKEKTDVPKLNMKSSKKSKDIILHESNENMETEVLESAVDFYMASLQTVKPNIFKGLTKEKVCSICEKPRGLTKCSGLCGEMYHEDCVKNQLAKPLAEESHRHRRKRKRGRKTKNFSSNDHDSGDESQMDQSTVSANNDTSPESKDNGVGELGVVKLLINRTTELNLSPDMKADGLEENIPKSIITNAIDFESQLEKRMQEMLNEHNTDNDLDISSTSIDMDNEWSGVKAGECVIVDISKHKTTSTAFNQSIQQNSGSDCVIDTFKCNDCQTYQTPLCFVCKSTVCEKNGLEERQKCNVPHCNKYYHSGCMQVWPQTKFSTTCPTKYQKKSQVLEALSCPRHVCHSCVSDDPRGNRTRFTGDKLARCVRCPATYHSLIKCVPAGTRLLTASHIICPRHDDAKSSKVPYHVNTSWCFICAKGGSLICCETCPTSFHAECLKISPPEGSYICEDCETGRLPLYEEMVWVKLGHYRWWPALILHPAEVPPNILAIPHAPNHFAVRFFGDYDHFWINSGRVFPYQEDDDTGRAYGKKSAVDNRYLAAMKQAKQAYNIIKNIKSQHTEDDELAGSVLPPQYVKLKVNRPVGGAALNYKNDKMCAHKCECDPTANNPCASDSDCINRMLHVECSPNVCAAGEKCCNQAFEKRQYPPLAPSKTLHRGWGLKALADIKKGDFVIEYVGEVIDEEEFQRRMAKKREIRDENYYFLTLDKDRMIDAGPKGNAARFMNHSCEPNCVTEKWTVNGDTRVGLFALRDIPAGSEVTFNYNLMCADGDKKKCMCGAKRCAGFIGAKVIQDDPIPKNPKKINMKRKYTRRSLDSASTKSAKSKTPLNSKKRKSLPPNKCVEEDGIEKDWKEINEAVLVTGDQEMNNLVDTNEKLNSCYKESKKESCIIQGATPTPSSCDESDHVLTGKSCNGYEEAFSQFIQEKARGEKRKYSPDCDALKKSKRSRSNSVHFSENVICVQSDGVIVRSPLIRTNRYTIDGDCLELSEESSKSAKRGSSKKSVVQNEI